MRALIKERPGRDGLVLREVDEPAPGQGQVVIAVHAAGICGCDLHIRHGRPPVELRYQWLADHPDLPVPVTESPESFLVAVAGGPGNVSQFFWGNYGVGVAPVED